MGTPLYMDITQAISICREYSELHCSGDILRGLALMESYYDELDKEDRVAYRMFMREGRRMFEPGEDE